MKYGKDEIWLQINFLTKISLSPAFLNQLMNHLLFGNILYRRNLQIHHTK